MPEKPDPDPQPTNATTGGRCVRLTKLLAELRITLAEATQLLDTAPDTSSPAWFDLSERLQDACWNLAAATHRLNASSQPSRPTADANVSAPRHNHRRRRR